MNQPSAYATPSPPPTPAPPVTSLGTRSWLAIAGATTGFLLIAAAAVALVLDSSGGANPVHAATVVTVTAPAAATVGGSPPGGGESSSGGTGGQKGSGDLANNGTGAENSTPLDMVVYQGASFSAAIPAGWSILENEAHKPGYIESKWGNPDDPSDTVLIDTSPATPDTLEEDAAPVHNALLSEHGYEQLSYRPGDLVGVESFMWVFRIPGTQRVDYFFNRCASGFAMLGSTTPSRFDQLTSTFRAVAQSVEPSNRTPPC